MLALLDRGPAHGYELRRAHDELFGDVAPPVNIGQIYVTLTRLERDGSVTQHTEKGTDGPDRKVYELTQTGRKSLRGWLDEPSDLPVGKSDVAQKLVASLICDGGVSRTVAEHRTRCLRALRTLTEIGAAADSAAAAGRANRDGATSETPAAGIGDLLREASVLHLQAELRWLDLVDERLTRDRRA